MKKCWALLAIVFTIFCYCSQATESKSRFNPPDDHSISKDGARHKEGLKNPMENCVECHGDDLRGGMVPVSCYTCHGKKW